MGKKFLSTHIGRSIAAISLTLALALTAAPSARSETQLPFPRPASIEPNIKFWVDVFTAYSMRDFVVVDRDNVWRTYQVYHLPGEGQPTREEIDWANAYLKIKYADILNRLASGREAANDEERHVAAMFKGEPAATYTAAAQNLRVQEGLREQFHEGLLRSRYYRPTMERIFRTAGLPPELVTLAQVESGFHGGSRSSAGAVGIWQFTRDTGKHYMKITRYHDDRLIPDRASVAAAKLLRSNYGPCRCIGTRTSTFRASKMRTLSVPRRSRPILRGPSTPPRRSRRTRHTFTTPPRSIIVRKRLSPRRPERSSAHARELASATLVRGLIAR